LLTSLRRDAAGWREAGLTLIVFYASGALAAVALVLSRLGRPAALRAAQASLCAAVFSAALAGWIIHAGGQVRHPEFRLGPLTGEAYRVSASKQVGLSSSTLCLASLLVLP